MKTQITYFAGCILLCMGLNLKAQNAPVIEIGGGSYEMESGECLSDAERKVIWEQLEASRADLQKKNLLPTADEKAIVLFDWPLKLRAGISYPSYYLTGNYVDEQPGAGVLDYNCGNRTYDGHKGTDIGTWPSHWRKQANNEIEVISSAPGVIIYRQETHPDQSCATTNPNWNAVYVQHSDGSVAWYGHLKRYSLTSKTVGMSVAAGEFLGIMGSSGYSSGPHLHFEVYNATNQLVDPWGGPCNSIGGQSWWAAQKPYMEPSVMHVAVHNQSPSIQSCPPETYTESNVIYQGETAWYTGYFRDQLPGTAATYQVRRPDNTLFSTYTFNFNQAIFASWWILAYTIGTNEPTGLWKFSVTYNGQTFNKNFHVRSALAVSPEFGYVNSLAGTATYSINTSGAWSVADNATWVSVSPVSGTNNGTFTATFAANSSPNVSRTCRIAVTHGADVRYIYLTQASTNGVSCLYPAVTSVMGINNRSATLWWLPIAGANGYDVQYRPAGGAWVNLGANTSNFVTVGNLASNAAYQFRVRTRCGAGRSAWVIKNFNTTAFSGGNAPDLLAIPGEPQITEMQVFPNPAMDEVKLQLSDDAATDAFYQVFCFNHAGSLALEQKSLLEENGQLRMDVSNVPPGLYVVQCRNTVTGQAWSAKLEVGVR